MEARLEFWLFELTETFNALYITPVVLQLWNKLLELVL